MDVTNLIVYLPFDESKTQDLCSNEWTAYGTTSIDESNAIAENALQLNKGYLRSNSAITFGGADFTVSFCGYMSSSSEAWAGFFCAQSTTNTGDNGRPGQINLHRNNSGGTIQCNCYNSSGTNLFDKALSGTLTNGRHHFELDYSHADSTLRVFVDGQINVTQTVTLERLSRYIFFGANSYNPSQQRMVGTLDEFRLFDGVALHTENFTPPTDNDYIALKLVFAGFIPVTLNCDVERKVEKTVELNVDVERQISNSNFLVADFDVERKVIKSVQVNADVERILYRTWRYENAGTDDSLSISGTTLTNLPDDKSVTGTAFFQTQQAKSFDLPATSEIWIKFDVYWDGINFWRVFNANSGFNPTTPDGYLRIRANGSIVADSSTNPCAKNTLQTVLAHMRSGTTDGVIEAWVDGQFIHKYIGNVNHGEDFADIYLQSDGAGTFFSNVIISNKKLDFGDGWHTINFDTERNVTKTLVLNVDVERELIAPIIVPFIGEHFNHIIGSLNLKRGGKKKIILPKKSEVYIRAVGAGIIEVYSDTDANRKILGDNFLYPNELYAAFEPCENIFIKIRNQTTPQHVIKAFMKYLADFDGTLDEAINYATGGKFATRDALAVQFMNDLDSSSSYTDFLENYCDIDLDNADTGAITGSDAGGIEKTAESVVPEKIPVEDWIVPDSGEVVTINGLIVGFPNRVSGRTPAAFTAHILAGLYSVWIKQSLDLIEETYGISFNDEAVTRKSLSITLLWDSSNNAIAWTTFRSDATIELTVNTSLFADIDTTSEDGALIPSSPKYYSVGYLDRTIVHELTHAIMRARIKNFSSLPLFITEGTAELVHGIDDFRYSVIVDLLTTNKSTLEDILTGTIDGTNQDPYAAGYMFLRYLAKQGQNTKLVPAEIEITNLLISDGATDSNYEALTDNTRQIFYPDVLRTLAKTYEINFDVEILNVIRVDFTADVKRALLMHVNLFPMNREDFFADENNPYVVRTNKSRLKKLRAGQSQNPFNIANNTPGMQSFEVAIAEQQVTDQVRFTRVLPASADYFKQFSMNMGQWDINIMQEFRGKYLDYEYSMRVERIQRQGRTYSCECCSDLDKLLYTQLAYKVPAMTVWTSDEGTTEQKTIQTVYPKASAHAKLIAEALGLNFKAKENALFGDFLSTVLMDDMGGVTYNDLIRDIFGWSARIPHKMINVCIRNKTLWIIERGQEPNMIDISAAEKSEPIITRELVRTAWGSSITSNTNTTEFSTKTYVPPDKVINTPDTPEEPEEKVREVNTNFSGKNTQGYTTYTYNDDGLLIQTHTYVHNNNTGQNTYTTVTNTYDKEGIMVGTETFTQSMGTEGDSASRSVDEKYYITLPSGEKFLAAEYTATYQNDKSISLSDKDLIDSKYTTHSPSRVGQSHTTTVTSDGEVIGSVGGQNTGDDRVTPFRNKKSSDLKTAFDSTTYNAETGTWEENTKSKTTTVYGLSLYDSSFPIHNVDKLEKVTADLKALNRATKETVHITIYNFPHLIDFLDRIVLYGGVYHLSSNIARSTNDILSEQQLTLVKWDLSKVEEESEEGGE